MADGTLVTMECESCCESEHKGEGIPHMQNQVILGMPWLVQEDLNIWWACKIVALMRNGHGLSLPMVSIKTKTTSPNELIYAVLCK